MIPIAPTPPHGERIRLRNALATPAARPRIGRAWRGMMLAAWMWGICCAGCVEERSSIDLQRVPMPEGGSVYTVAVLEGATGPNIIAPSHAGLFIHHEDRGAWELIDPRGRRAPLRDRLLAPRPVEPSEDLTPSRRALNFRPSELFSAHDGRIWVAPGLSQTRSQKLLSSEDLGRTWTRVALPTIPARSPEAAALEEAPQEDAPDEHSDEQPDDGAPTEEAPAEDSRDSDASEKPDAPRNTSNPAHLRFVNAGALGFYLMGASNLWKLDLAGDAILGDDATPDAIWTPISLAGAELGNDANRTKLPHVLRHYLPAAPERPFELLSMLRERIYIYRRDAETEHFKEVAALEGADIQFATIPGSNIVLFLTSEGLFKSEDAGETWTQLTWYALSQDDARGTAMQVLAATPEAPATLLVALETGAVYRSEDLGEKFTEVRAPDPDQRGITDFGYSPQYERVWAATNGSGVLRSLDRGQTWQPINDELRATRVSDIGADKSDGFLLGSESGLYRLSGPPQNGQWQMLQPRATTAIRVDRDSGAILSGTTTGAIVRLETNGKSTVSQASPEEPTGATAFRAPRFRGLDLPARAIVGIEAHPDDPQVYAWSAKRGPLASLDSGVSWTSLALNPAFESALEGSYISNFTTEIGERIYLVTRGLNASAPTQLWRSYNNGETWHAVSSFERGARPSDVFLAHNARLAPENIFMAHRDRFARSLDGGSSWRDLKGPWSDGEILLYELVDDKHLLIVERYQTTHLVHVTDTEQERAHYRSYQLNWPDRNEVDRADIHNIAVQSGQFFLSTDRGLFTGKMPDDSQRLPNGLAILVALISVSLLTVIGFGVMRLTT